LASEAPQVHPICNDWLELQLTESGGFTGLTRQAKIIKSHLTQAHAKDAQQVLQQLWDHEGKVLPSNLNDYPDAQKLQVEVTTKQGQWVQTLNADELPDELSAMCRRANWKPI
jgi:hypothetical protein